MSLYSSSSHSRSLRWRFVKALVLVTGAMVGGGLLWLRSVMLADYHEEIIKHVAVISDSIVYAVETAEREDDLQRFVAASGGIRDVRRILVVVGIPARVIAATRQEWVGLPLDLLPDSVLRDVISSAMRRKSGPGVAVKSEGSLRLVSSLRTAVGSAVLGGLEPGAVFVEFSTGRYDAAQNRIRWLVGVILVLSVLVVAVAAWMLFWFLVVHPLVEIRQRMVCCAMGHKASFAPSKWEGEVGDLARTYNKMLLVLQESERHAMESESRQRAARANLTAFFDLSVDLLCVLDSQGAFVLANKTLLHRLGYKAEELAGRSVLTVHPPDRYAEAEDIVREMIAGRRDTCRIPLQAKNGQLIPVETRIVQGIWDGKPALFGICKDLTELVRSEEKFAKAFHAVPVMMAVSTLKDGRFIDVNEAFLAGLGFARDEVIGRTSMELGAFQDPAIRRRIIERFEQTGRIHGEEVEFMTKTRAIRHGLFSMETIHVMDETCILSAMMDITDRKRSEQILETERVALVQRVQDQTIALRASEELYRELFHHMAQGVLYLAPDGSALMANPAAESILGLDVATLRTVRFQDARWQMVRENGAPMAPHDHPAAVAFRTGHPVHGVVVGVCNQRDSNQRWVWMDAVPEFRAGESMPWRAFTTFTDITAQMHAQKQLFLAQKLECVGRLAGGVAHDFNNCMACVLGFAEMLEEAMPRDDRNLSYLGQIQRAAQQAADVTKQLLAFSRQQVLTPKPEEINQLVEGQMKMLHRLIGEDIRIELDLQPGGVVAIVDPVQFQQVVMNLCINARDAMPGGGVLRIQTRTCEHVVLPDEAKQSEAGYVQMSFADTGVGMRPEVLSRIFEPFFTTKEVGRGTGLGLAVIHGIVRQHGGWIDVESREGQGTRFDVYWPSAISGAEARGGVAGAVLMHGHGEVVLLVEDNVAVREIVAGRLRKLGYQVLEAATKAEGIAIFRAAKPSVSVLLSDVVLTDGTGVALAETILAESASVKIILTSGYADERSRISHIEACGWSFIAKPYTKEAIGKALHSLLHPSPLVSCP